MKEQITESFRALEAEKKIREQLVAEKDKELASIDARLHRALEAEQQMRRESEVPARTIPASVACQNAASGKVETSLRFDFLHVW